MLGDIEPGNVFPYIYIIKYPRTYMSHAKNTPSKMVVWVFKLVAFYIIYNSKNNRIQHGTQTLDNICAHQIPHTHFQMFLGINLPDILD